MLCGELDHVAAGDLEVAGCVDAAAPRVDRRARDRVAAHHHRRPVRSLPPSDRHCDDPGAACEERSAAARERVPICLPPSRPPTAFDGFVDGFADRRFGPGDAVDDFFGHPGDAGFLQRAAGDRFVDRVDGAVDGFGHFRRGRAAAAGDRLGRLLRRLAGDLVPPPEPLLPPLLLLEVPVALPPPEVEGADGSGRSESEPRVRRVEPVLPGCCRFRGCSPPVRSSVDRRRAAADAGVVLRRGAAVLVAAGSALAAAGAAGGAGGIGGGAAGLHRFRRRSRVAPGAGDRARRRRPRPSRRRRRGRRSASP